MSYKHIKTVMSEMQNGCTNPLNCILDDGKRVVFKAYNNEQGNRVLANEYVTLRIAKKLGLTIPDGGLAILDDETVNYVSNICINKGVGFYSVREESVTIKIDKDVINKYCINRDELMKFILFDHLIYNKDRNTGNILYSIKKNIIYIIDHTHCFNLESIWDSSQLKKCIEREDYKDNIIMENNFHLYNKFIFIDNYTLDNLYSIKNDFENLLNRDFFEKIVKDIPDEWRIDDEDKMALIEYLDYRLKKLDNMCKIIIGYKEV